MTPQELKSSILQLAIQGRLVEQRPEEGTGDDLYQEIQAEKRRLIKAGKIKREKPLPEITKDKKPFDIPENWILLNVENITYLVGNKNNQIQTNEILSKGSIPVVSQGQSHIDGYTNQKEKVIDDLPLVMFGDHTKNVKFVDFPFVIGAEGTHFHKCILAYPQYIYYWMVYAANKLRNRGYARHFALLKEQYIPLPPLAEQKRIVARIEELLPYIDRYEQAWSKLEELNKRFPDDMQKSLLQYAIQGKLVEQRPEEGTGEELYVKLCLERNGLVTQKKFRGKKHPKLPEEELPFDIPDTWKWVRLGDIISIESGKGLTAAQMAGGSIPVYGGNGITGYHNESLIQEETVVIGRVGFYCGSVHLTEQKSWVTDNAFITTYPQDSIDRKFLVYMLRHMNLGRDNNATAQPVVSGKKIYPLAFPLPPLAEQKRIVAKLEEILPLCEKLKK